MMSYATPKNNKTGTTPGVLLGENAMQEDFHERGKSFGGKTMTAKLKGGQARMSLKLNDWSLKVGLFNWALTSKPN